MSGQGKSSRRWVRVLIALGVVLLLVAVVWWVMKAMSASDEPLKRRAIQEIALLKPPPPPPPPKTPPPPPKEVKQTIDQPKPSAQPNDPAPKAPIDGIQKGPAGGMSTDIAEGTSKSPVLLQESRGGTGDRFSWYGALVKERIQDAVQKNQKLRGADFRVMVNVWVDAAGLITRVELVDSTKAADLDETLRSALRGLAAIREGAPSDMPQPIKLRITAR